MALVESFQCDVILTIGLMQNMNEPKGNDFSFSFQWHHVIFIERIKNITKAKQVYNQVNCYQ